MTQRQNGLLTACFFLERGAEKGSIQRNPSSFKPASASLVFPTGGADLSHWKSSPLAPSLLLEMASSDATSVSLVFVSPGQVGKEARLEGPRGCRQMVRKKERKRERERERERERGE